MPGGGSAQPLDPQWPRKHTRPRRTGSRKELEAPDTRSRKEGRSQAEGLSGIQISEPSGPRLLHPRPNRFSGSSCLRGGTLLLGLRSGLCLLRPSCGFPCDLGIKSPELGVAWEALPLGPPGALAAPTAPFPVPGRRPLRPRPDPATVIIPVLTSA